MSDPADDIFKEMSDTEFVAWLHANKPDRDRS